MKKALGVVLSITMLLAMSVNSFAANLGNTPYGVFCGYSSWTGSGSTKAYTTQTDTERKPPKLRHTYYVNNYATGASVVGSTKKETTTSNKINSTSKSLPSSPQVKGVTAHECIGTGTSSWGGTTSVVF